ncbi:MAG: diguanylate cyclase [Clostridia bacterium]|nr:diguanylate cyclase [Clostridia bacterium]NCD01693.1 diguanylate cyclase [Clostridia bacterium]
MQATAEAIEKCLPEGDEAARLAGDEFIVLHAMEEMEAEELAENIRKAIEGIDCASFAPGSSLESAIGVCKYSEAGNVRSLFKLADERMYALKKQRQDNGR